MPNILVIFIFLFFGLPAIAQQIKFNNYILNENGLIEVNYDLLNGKSNKSYTAVRVSANIGSQEILLHNAQGDVGLGIRPGLGKRIIWNPFEDNIQDTTGLKFTFEILAFPSKYAENGDKLTTPKHNSGALISSGIGLGICGLAVPVYLRSKELYKVYESKLNPNAPEYASTSRDDYLKMANNKFTKAQIILGSGASILASGIINFLVQKKWTVKWKEAKSWNLSPGMTGVFSTDSNLHLNESYGMKLTINFQEFKKVKTP